MSGEADIARELAIEECLTMLLRAPTPAAQRDTWEVMRALINGRSPEQVARMEIEMGLR